MSRLILVGRTAIITDRALHLFLYHVAPTSGGHSGHLCMKTSSVQTSKFTADKAVEHLAFTADFKDLLFLRELFHFAVGELLSV